MWLFIVLEFLSNIFFACTNMQNIGYTKLMSVRLVAEYKFLAEQIR